MGAQVTDDDIIDVMRLDGRPSVWVRYEGEQIRVITTNAADALPLLRRAVAGMTTPEGETIQ